MKITLNKANNILQKIHTELKRVELTQKRVCFQRNFSLVESPKTILSSIEKERVTYQEDRLKLVNLTEDYFSLKIAIFDFNSSLGLNKLLNEIEKLKRFLAIEERNLMSLNQNIIKDALTEEDILKEQEVNKDKEYCNTITIQLNFEKPEDVQDQIKRLKRQLNALEDKKIIINSSEIDIDLTDTTKDILGL
jgi:hypothetical protein